MSINVITCRILGVLAIFALLFGFVTQSIDYYAVPFIAVIAALLLGLPRHMLE